MLWITNYHKRGYNCSELALGAASLSLSSIQGQTLFSKGMHAHDYNVVRKQIPSLVKHHTFKRADRRTDELEPGDRMSETWGPP